MCWRLNLVISSTTVELDAIRLTVNHLFVIQDKTRAAILTDSRSALDMLLNNERASILALEGAEACWSTEDSGWTLDLE